MTHFTQITPLYPPAISGVGDYAAILADQFEAAGHLVHTIIPGQNEPAQKGVLPINRSAEGVAQALSGAEKVLLHFSGYGYEKRGLCRWLVEGLTRWKTEAPNRRLVTMFHEVYATGPIWRSSFWTALPQRRIAQGLAQLSDVGFVSSAGGFDQLRPLDPSLPVKVLEVFSNIGELASPCPVTERQAYAVIFGGPARRRSVYDTLNKSSEVRMWFTEMGISEIWDIGPFTEIPKSVADRPIIAKGPLLAKDVSDILASTRLGIIDYPGHVFSKSGIAAAYFSHGVPVLNTNNVGGYPIGLTVGSEIFSLDILPDNLNQLQAYAEAGSTWYRSHSIGLTQETFLKALQ